MKCVKDGVEIDRPVYVHDTAGVDMDDRTTWMNAKPLPQLGKGERVIWVDGDRRPHIIGGDDGAGEDGCA